jgi:hypothetical protein
LSHAIEAREVVQRVHSRAFRRKVRSVNSE